MGDLLDLNSLPLQLIAELINPVAAASQIISGLNGDVDKIYLIEFRLVKDAGNCYVAIRLNADNGVNYDWLNFSMNNGGAGQTHAAGDTSAPLHEEIANQMLLGGDYLVGWLKIYALSGVNRRWLYQTGHRRATDSTMEIDAGVGEWKNSATNITSLTILASAGNIGGANSFIRVYKVVG